MRWTNAFIPTLKEDPQDAEVISHKLMIRASLIRKLTAGAYSYLPLGYKVLSKVQNIIREEMVNAGAIEVLLPALQPLELWKKTTRDKDLGQVLIKFRDRHGKIMCLGPTHEEVITQLVSKEVSSYRDLPKILFQIQAKFRDELRPRFGVLRSCEFIMKDAYSFDATEKDLEVSYKKMYDAYKKIFFRCGLPYKIIEADPGIMGGGSSNEFIVQTKGSAEDIELGHTFKLGTKYSKALSAKFLAKDGTQHDIIMGCYGIGVNRIIAALIETSHDKDGIIWPASIAPYEVVVLPLNMGNAKLKQISEGIYDELKGNKIDAILDDRNVSAGIKFKDADLIGFPLQIIIGEKNLKDNLVEIKLRKTGKIEKVKVDNVVARFIEQKKEGKKNDG